MMSQSPEHTKPIDIFDERLNSHAIITVSRERGTELYVGDDDLKGLVLREFPKLRLKKWRRVPEAPSMIGVRIRHRHGLSIAKALARHGLRTLVQDMTDPGRITFIPLDALLRESRPDLS